MSGLVLSVLAHVFADRTLGLRLEGSRLEGTSWNGRVLSWSSGRWERERKVRKEVGIWKDGPKTVEWIHWDQAKTLGSREFLWLLSRGAGTKILDEWEWKEWLGTERGGIWKRAGKKVWNGRRGGIPEASVMKKWLESGIKRLKEEGWVVRKEDNGRRWVLVERKQEEAQIVEGLRKRGGRVSNNVGDVTDCSSDSIGARAHN
jgi:hypothetical protein